MEKRTTARIQTTRNRGRIPTRDGNDRYYVEKIVAKRAMHGEIEYLVKWWGWKASTNTWEPWRRLKEDCPSLLQAFEDEQKQKRKRLRTGRERCYDSSTSECPSEKKKNYSIKTPEVCEVEKILKRKEKETKGDFEYLVKWKGYGADFNTWESRGKLFEECPQMVKEYDADLRTKQRNLKEVLQRKRSPQETHIVKRKSTDDKQNERMEESPQSSTSNQAQKAIYQPQPDVIIGAIKIEDEDDIMYLMKWKNSTKANYIPSSEAYKLYPTLVIEFFEERIVWSDDQQDEEEENDDEEEEHDDDEEEQDD